MKETSEKRGWTLVVKGENHGKILERVNSVLGFQPTIAREELDIYSSLFQSLTLDITVDPDRVAKTEDALNKWYLQTLYAIPGPMGSLIFYNNTPVRVLRSMSQLSLNSDPVERVIEAMERR